MNTPSSQLGRHMMDGTISTLLAESLFPLTGLITATFLTRSLGPSGYGMFTLAATLVIWAETIVMSFFSRPTIKFVSEADDWQPVGSTMTRLFFFASLGLAFLLWLLADFTAALLNESVLATYLRLFAIEIPILGLSQAHCSILIGLGAFRQRAIASATRWIARLILIVLLVELGLFVPGAILGSIGAMFVLLAIGRFYIRPSLFSSSSTFPVRRVWDYAVTLFLFAVSLQIFSRLDLLFIKALGGTAKQAGIYAAAQNITLIPAIFTLSFSPLLLSTLGRLRRAEDDHSVKQISLNAMRAVIGLIPFAGMTAGAAPEIVGLIFGQPYLSAAPLLSLLIFGSIATIMVSTAAVIMISANRPNWTLTLAGPLVPLAIAGHLVMIPRLGPLGASLVTTTLAGLAAMVAVPAVYRIQQVLPPAGTLWRSILICGLSYALAVLWPAPGFLLLLKLLVIGLMIVVAFLLLGEFSASELALVRSMIHAQTVSKQNSRSSRKV